MDYYNERKFICELSGHSSLTYFEAVENEAIEAEIIIGSFPEPLKEPILRKVQFCQTSRLDTLVDDLYNQLRQDFYPGEVVIAKSNEQRIKVIIREKAKFNAITLSTGEVQPGYSRYRVEVVGDPTMEMAVDDTQLTRDRKLFTKIILRTFIKHAVSRESWSGAPWLVKSKYAEKYRIDTEIPTELLKQNPHYQQMLDRTKKQEMRQKAREEKARELAELKARNLELKAERKAQIWRNQRLKREEEKARLRGQNGSSEGTPYHSPQWILPNDQGVYSQQSSHFQYAGDVPGLSPIQAPSMGNIETMLPSISSVVGGPIVSTTPISIAPAVASSASSTRLGSSGSVTVVPSTSSKRSANQDDLLFIPTGEAPKRAPFRKDVLFSEGNDHLLTTLLESWLFLNVYHEPLLLDSFTFDDFVDVLKYADEETEIPLLNEIHCALLSAIVGTSNSELLISMPYYDREENEDTAEVDADEDVGKLESEAKHAYESDIENTNSQKVEDKMDIDTKDNNDSLEDNTSNHRASSFLRYQNVDWKERLKKRMFKDGGWQQIAISVLHSVNYVPEWTEIINEILSYMASSERGVTLAAAHTGYYELSFELRTRILEILCHLVYSSSVIRNHIDRSLEESTKLRKDRMDRQRETKGLVEQLKGLEVEKRGFISDEIAAQKEHHEQNEKQNGRAPVPLVDEAEMAKKNSEFAKVVSECDKITKTIEEYADLNKKCEEELIRLDCQRLRMLGKDRYYNRYWWFESNGMKRPESIGVKKTKSKTMKKEEVDEDIKEEDKHQGSHKIELGEEQDEPANDDDVGVKREEDGPDVDIEDPEPKNTQKNQVRSKPKKRPDRKPKTRSRKRSHVAEESDDEAEEESEDEGDTAEEVKEESEAEKEDTEDEENSGSTGNELVAEYEDSDEEEPVGYAMGRLWIQGPTEEDALVYLKREQSQIVANNKNNSKDEAANGTGSTALTPYDLKEKDESPVFLASYNDWAYYDTSEEIQALIEWLNPHGLRESKLLKELGLAKPYLLGSIEARKEDMEADKLSQMREIQETIDEEFGIISDDEDNNDVEASEETAGETNVLVEGVAGSEAAIEADLEGDPDNPPDDEIVVGRRRLRSRNSDVTSASAISPPQVETRRRGPGRPAKRVALDKEAIARERHKRMEDKQTRRESKNQRREELIAEMSSKVPSRVLAWTNSIVESTLGHTHYEGPLKKRGLRKSKPVHKEWTNDRR
ncbi:Itc1p [Sugiyamaella lignohabitans]|uniref:Itc1p n=1 Tax=Sugiyamaella lignohabitans TaxID=796027 RepID=A0A161HHV0_9ASCO|nr:Itc1p [Sugiyamaella lignohabitans]ANB15680.1 Itc1p [Sugiyamaella lignohabitans]